MTVRSARTAIKNLLPNPVKKAACDMMRSFGEPPLRLQNLLAYHGDFTVDVNGKPLRMVFTNNGVENALFWHGVTGYETQSMKLWMEAAVHAVGVADIGANTGVFGLVAKTLNPQVPVAAFEPLPRFYEILQQNFGLNQMTSGVHLAKSAVSNFEGQATFFVPEEHEGVMYASSLSREFYGQHSPKEPLEVTVDVTTFDSFVATHQIERVDLFKIDAEGHDANVLEGMKNAIRAWEPSFLIEVLDENLGQRIMALLPPDEYCYFNIDEKKGVERTTSLGKSASYNFFVCPFEQCPKLPSLKGLA